MKKEDFKFKEVDYTDGHIDYWFLVNGETRKELDDKYRGEQGFIGIPQVLYSKDEDAVSVRRQFHCSYDVILSEDKSLKEILKSIVQELSN